ncbi:MAG: energy transducer TonB [Pyrinomonadaceae bacterium]|nr:energy transducer TonB [Pyrinomonadaceae bacterium]
MKKKIILTTIVSLFLAAAISAQTTKPSFAGEWELDVGKSTLTDTKEVEAMTLMVTQTEKNIKIETVTKINQSQSAGGAKRGDGRKQISHYRFDKEMTVELSSPTMTGTAVSKATATADGKLSLTRTHNYNTAESGIITGKTNEIWELTDEGKTLKITRYKETLRGSTNAEMYFTKKSPTATSSSEPTVENKVYQGQSMSGTDAMPKKISGGVLNGKAVSLPKPAYPAEARATRASGAVSVKVTIDEAGEVVSAEAVSGDVLLREASVEAAKKAKFAPTMLQGVPVKVTGVIVYNFVP